MIWVKYVLERSKSEALLVSKLLIIENIIKRGELFSRFNTFVRYDKSSIPFIIII